MTVYNLRQFSDPDALLHISRENLLSLLSPYEDYFRKRGYELPPAGKDFDYPALCGILISPDTDTPNELAEALYLIDSCATSYAMDEILDDARVYGIEIELSPFSTTADIALQAYLKDPSFLERRQGLVYLMRRRSFRYFQTKADPLPSFRMPAPDKLKKLEGMLDDWFESKNRGRNSRVQVYERPDGFWFLVRHGEPFKREGSINERGLTTSELFRPEKNDVLVYNMRTGELAVNANLKSERDMYRECFGQCLFGDRGFFPGEGKFTLEPLRSSGAASLVVTDVDGIDRIVLREVEFTWDEKDDRETQTIKSQDVFATLAGEGRLFPEEPRIVSARFAVHFSGCKNPRMVTIRPSNVAIFTRDSDSTVVESWLGKRGFIREERDADNAEAA